MALIRDFPILESLDFTLLNRDSLLGISSNAESIEAPCCLRISDDLGANI
jgi:hypothetical protein